MTQHLIREQLVNKYACILYAALICGFAHGQIYKWTDSSGNVHFSDKPNPGAEQIQLPTAQTYSQPTKAEVPATTEPPPPDDDANQPYRSVTIVQPEDQSTVRNNQGYLPIIVQLEPDLRKGDTIQLIFDGTPLGEPQVTPLFALRDIDRGTHTIAVKVLGADGKELNASPIITVFMHQARIGMVPGTKKPQ